MKKTPHKKVEFTQSWNLIQCSKPYDIDDSNKVTIKNIHNGDSFWGRVSICQYPKAIHHGHLVKIRNKELPESELFPVPKHQSTHQTEWRESRYFALNPEEGKRVSSLQTFPVLYLRLS